MRSHLKQVIWLKKRGGEWRLIALGQIWHLSGQKIGTFQILNSIFVSFWDSKLLTLHENMLLSWTKLWNELIGVVQENTNGISWWNLSKWRISKYWSLKKLKSWLFKLEPWKLCPMLKKNCLSLVNLKN